MEKFRNFDFAQVQRVLEGVEEDESLNPMHVFLFSAVTVVPDVYSCADIVEEFTTTCQM